MKVIIYIRHLQWSRDVGEITMTHETELINVPEQHSIDKVLSGDSIDVCR